MPQNSGGWHLRQIRISRYSQAIAGLSELRSPPRVGLMQAIREKGWRSVRPDVADEQLGRTRQRGRKKLAFGKDVAGLFRRSPSRLSSKLMEGSVGGGAQTATRFANADDLGVETIKEAAAGAASAKAGDVPGAMSWIQKLVKQTDLLEPIPQQMGRILLLKGRRRERN